MNCMCCGHASIFHGSHGCTGGEAIDGGCLCPGYEAIPADARTIRTKATANVNTGAVYPLTVEALDIDGRVVKSATYVEGRAAPNPSGFTPMARELDRAAAAMSDAATVEACARAGVGVWNDPTSALATRWEVMTEGESEMWRDVARAVLAAARTKRAVNSGGAL